MSTSGVTSGRARRYSQGDCALSGHHSVVAFAVLAGTDLSRGVRGIGGKKAMLLLQHCHLKGQDALETLRLWRDRRPACLEPSFLAGATDQTRQILETILAHCKALHFPDEALIRTYLDPPQRAFEPLVAKYPSIAALRYANALTVVCGQRKHSSYAFIMDRVTPLLA